MTGLEQTLITAASVVITAFVTGGFAWWVGRPKAKADYAEVIQEGFSALLDQMKAQHENDQKEIKRCTEVAEDLADKVRVLTLYISKIEYFLRVKGLWEEAPKHGLVGIPRLNGSTD